MYNVVGIEMVDYVNKSNKRVRGVKLHCKYEKDSCNGWCVESIYLSEDKYDKTVELGDSVEPLYNKYGNVQSIHVVSHTGYAKPQ